MNRIRALFQLKRNDYEFLPSVLSIQERPPSPIGRMVLWTLAVFIILMMVWSWIGTVDIVATSQGKIIPDGKVKTIQVATSGVVDKILVHDGDYVIENQLLITLDETVVRAKLNQIRLQLHENSALLASLMELLNGIEKLNEIKGPKFSKTIPDRIRKRHLLLFEREVEGFESKINIQYNKLAQLENKKNDAEIQVRKLKATIPIIRKREIAFRKLLKKGMASETEYLDFKQAQLEAEYDVERQENLIQSLSLEIALEKAALKEIYSNKKLELQNRITETLASIERDGEDQTQQLQLLSLHEVRSPISGYVQDLVVYNKGQSLNATEDILRVVPNKDELIAEAMALNKDIGFLHVGQEAIVKVDTFNFVKHGSLSGEIIHISNDAVQDEQLGLVFKIKVKLKENRLQIDGKHVDVNSGMSVIVEAKTGSRRLIDFFLTPVNKTISEGMQER
ncbi:HlyD family type I secretion periplasmic adaptor subunit [Vibrio harveyi]|uniref:HlyD family type I secretion periplasmic adaptor subunit n=1 Tax=Vibrio harveyi TaxID=669 RepID=UPI003CFA1BB4